MNQEKYKVLDEAWAFAVSEISKGKKKKDIVPLLNEEGYTTLKGKPWTYQTLLLEQRRRANEVARQRVEEQGVGISTYSEPKARLFETSEDKFDLFSWVEEQTNRGLGLDAMCQELRRMEVAPPFGGEWSSSLLSHELGNRLLNSDDSDREGMDLDDGRSIGELIDKASPLELVESRRGIDEAWEMIEEEARKGTRKQEMVHVLNLNGLVTRRGKAWTYPVLSQEIRRRKELGQELPARRMILATAQQKEVSSRVNESISRAREMIEGQILPELKKRNLKTRKGREWTYPVLLLEMLRRDVDPESL
jgi:hypothetical protein